MIITASMLRENFGACESAAARFEEEYPQRS